MISNDLDALNEEMTVLQEKGEFAECIRRVERYADETADPQMKMALLVTKANCALKMGDIQTAQFTADVMDIDSLDPEPRNYVRLTLGCIAHQTGQFEKADSIYSQILGSQMAHAEDARDLVCRATAGKAFAQAELRHYTVALSLLDMASALQPDAHLRDDIGIYRALCLQGLGRLDEAEQFVKEVLAKSSGKSDADAWFRLGGIVLQRGEYRTAVESLYQALAHVGKTGVTRANILAAITETEKRSKEAETHDSEIKSDPPVQ